MRSVLDREGPEWPEEPERGLRQAYRNLDGAIAVDFPRDVEGPAAICSDREPSFLVRLEAPDRTWVGRVLQGLGDGGEWFESAGG